MGINTSIGALLLAARDEGVDFSHTMTIGRQALTIPPEELSALAKKHGIENAQPPGFAADGWADDFFVRFLGAASVSSMDYSDYQSADIVHDLNKPVPDELRERFDCVIDGGTIEHVFDVRQVLENYMGMVKLGGSLFIATPANNLCGHGFYQFSPEFFYRVFSTDNGFAVRNMVLIESPLLSVEASRHLRYFHVVDPEKIRKRVELVNCKPVMLFVHAERRENVPLFASNPYQSDYQTQWKEAQREDTEGKPAQPFRYESRWKEFRRRLRQRKKNGLHRGRFFTPFKP